MNYWEYEGKRRRNRQGILSSFWKKYVIFLKLHFGLEPTCKRSPSQRLCESNHEERSTTRRKTIVFDQKSDLYEKGAKRGQMMPNCTGINLDYRRKSQFLVMATCTTPLNPLLSHKIRTWLTICSGLFVQKSPSLQRRRVY